jgi:hypothetical protein
MLTVLDDGLKYNDEYVVHDDFTRLRSVRFFPKSGVFVVMRLDKQRSYIIRNGGRIVPIKNNSPDYNTGNTFIEEVNETTLIMNDGIFLTQLDLVTLRTLLVTPRIRFSTAAYSDGRLLLAPAEGGVTLYEVTQDPTLSFRVVWSNRDFKTYVGTVFMNSGTRAILLDHNDVFQLCEITDTGAIPLVPNVFTMDISTVSRDGSRIATVSTLGFICYSSDGDVLFDDRSQRVNGIKYVDFIENRVIVYVEEENGQRAMIEFNEDFTDGTVTNLEPGTLAIVHEFGTVIMM